MTPPIAPLYRRCRSEDRPKEDLPACRADACSQGKKPCPCPSACMVPADAKDVLYIWAWPAGIIVAIASVSMLVSWFS